ncbi:LPP20 family lipoprotein [Saccharicrinis carchari]|nr:LPP20 family lipoprotein [Saccharicrinis carchari]
MRNSLYLFVLLTLLACSSQKKQRELLEQSKPAWLKQRPVNSDYYYGIGIAPKVGAAMLFEDKAKEKALADISSQINSTIQAEAIFYQVEDKQGVKEYLQNRIKSTSAEYLEGYEYLDKWEDLSNTYAFYRLSKQKHKEVKIRRKNEALKMASDKYLMGISRLSNGQHVAAIEHFALVIDALSGYLNESTVADVQGKKIDLVSESTREINTIVRGLNFISDVETAGFETCYIVCDAQKKSVSNMPVQLKYSGAYLVNDRIKTDHRGKISLPHLSATNNTVDNALVVQIDLVSLGRQVTRNLYVRKIIEQQKASEVVVKITKQGHS